MPTWGQILTALGGWTGVLLLLGNALYKQAQKGLEMKWQARLDESLERAKHEHNKEIERLRDDLSVKRDVVNNAIALMNTGFGSSHGQITEAITKLWSMLIDIRDFASRAVFVQEFLLPKEIENVTVSSKIDELVDLDFDTLSAKVQEFGSEIERVRPFIGETIWSLFSVYRAFWLRLCWKMAKDKKRGVFHTWNKTPEGEPDRALYELLEVPLTKDEIAGIEAASAFGAPGRLAAAIESKILSEMNLWVFGRKMASLTLEEQQRIRGVLDRPEIGGEVEAHLQSEDLPKEI